MIMKLLGRMKIKKILKKQGKTGFVESVRHAIHGICYTTDKEKNFRVEIMFAIIVTIASFVLKVSLIEWAILVLVIGMVLSLEMINTAIERCVDLVTKEYRDLAKFAKDVAAGAVLIMSLFSVIIGIIIFLPKILEMLGGK